jgi:hypothetical protein
VEGGVNPAIFANYLCIVSCYFFSFLPFALRAQDNRIKDVVMAPPNAASLGKYGDIPVSNHTGVPNIDIPIYTVSDGHVSLPISLSYHSGGVKVDEMASWVGLGWSLNAGGMISRTVQGAPDDASANKGWYASNQVLPEFSYTGPSQTATDLYNAASVGNIDAEPDLFFFNFGGASGKFFFDRNKNPVIYPEADFKITVNGTGLFTNWVITTSDGTKYFFGGTAVEKSKSGNQQTARPFRLYRIQLTI